MKNENTKLYFGKKVFVQKIVLVQKARQDENGLDKGYIRVGCQLLIEGKGGAKKSTKKRECVGLSHENTDQVSNVYFSITFQLNYFIFL